MVEGNTYLFNTGILNTVGVDKWPPTTANGRTADNYTWIINTVGVEIMTVTCD